MYIDLKCSNSKWGTTRRWSDDGDNDDNDDDDNDDNDDNDDDDDDDRLCEKMFRSLRLANFMLMRLRDVQVCT